MVCLLISTLRWSCSSVTLVLTAVPVTQPGFNMHVALMAPWGLCLQWCSVTVRYPATFGCAVKACVAIQFVQWEMPSGFMGHQQMKRESMTSCVHVENEALALLVGHTTANGAWLLCRKKLTRGLCVPHRNHVWCELRNIAYAAFMGAENSTGGNL